MVSKSSLALHEQIRQAIDAKNVDDLNKCIYECEISEYPELGTDVREAREVVRNLGGADKGQLHSNMQLFQRLLLSYCPFVKH